MSRLCLGLVPLQEEKNVFKSFLWLEVTWLVPSNNKAMQRRSNRDATVGQFKVKSPSNCIVGIYQTIISTIPRNRMWLKTRTKRQATNYTQR